MATPFKTLCEVLERVESTKKRLEILKAAAQLLETLETEEVEPAVSMILGRPFPMWSQQTLEVSWATVSSILQKVTTTGRRVFTQAMASTADAGETAKKLFEHSKTPRQTLLAQKQLEILYVRQTLEAVASTKGTGSREKKARLIESLFRQASPIEAKYLTKILIGEMRTGLHEGLAEQAIAKAFSLPLSTVQKASMTLGDTGEVAKLAKTEGLEALSRLKFMVFRPVKLMLAQVADSVEEALKTHNGETALEYKYDGARVQIHKLGEEVKLFSRRLTDATESLPEIVETLRTSVEASEAILEGEIIATDAWGNPIPFQHLMRRFKRVHGIADKAEEIPLKLHLFDIIYLNDESMIDLPYLNRRKILAKVAGNIHLAEQIITSKAETAEKFLNEAMSAGHEGLMAKKTDGPYTPGKRGENWLKIKPILQPLDLVITAAEYGYGRRHGWLSDYYLAARDPEDGSFLELGKTFKGLTDEEIKTMTERLKQIASVEKQGRVTVLPKIVVEVAYNEIQKSKKYKSEMALRFARITRIRIDKKPEEADTIQRVREIYEKQFLKKGRYKAETHT